MRKIEVFFYLSALVFISILILFKTNTNYFWYFSKPLVGLQLIIIAPIAEELLFRGLVFENLKRIFDWKIVNILTSLIFASAHFFYHSPLWAISIIIPSLCFGYVKEKSNSLFNPIALHIFYNFVYFSVYEY